MTGEAVTVDLHVTATFLQRRGALVSDQRVRDAIEAAVAEALADVVSTLYVADGDDIAEFTVDECCIVGRIGSAVAEIARDIVRKRG